VLLISLGIEWYYISKERNKLLALTNTISVPLGQRVNVTLSDGTKVCLNALSELQYPTFFAGKDRKVKLKGEAFFDVIHNADRPFVVETEKYNVEVLGTTFDVQAYPNTDKFLTSLLKGKVRIVNNKIPGQTIILNPNEQAYFANKKLIVRQIPDLDVFNWREGLLCFKQSSFQTLMHRFEECYDVQIIIRKYPSLENEFTGKMRISDGLDHAIRVLQMNTQFTYRWDEKMRIIYIE
jgi:ferric-dicitrate binding protein FerR (iron transport regulator)